MTLAPAPQSRWELIRDIALLRYETLGRFVQKLFSIRLMFGSLILGVIVGAVLSLVAEPLVWAWVPVAVTVWWLGAANPEHQLYCPHCRKRVKAGASTCHHCGQPVS